MKKRFGAMLGALAIAATTAMSTLPASAADQSSLNEGFVAELTSVWSTHGVPDEMQAQLLDRLEGGEPVDAMLDTEEAVSIETASSEGKTVTVSRYEDGSINVVSVEAPPEPSGDITPSAVEGCAKSGTVWINCNVSGWFTGVTLAFGANLRVGSPTLGEPGRIDKFTQPTVGCIPPLSCTPPEFEMIQSVQSGATPAQLHLTTYWSGVGTGTTRLILYVKDGSAYTN